MASQVQNFNSNADIFVSVQDFIIRSFPAVLGFITPWIFLLVVFWKRRIKKNSFSDDGPKRSKDYSSLSGDQYPLPQNFLEQLNFLRDVTDQISEDRKAVMESAFQEFSTVQKKALKYIASQQSSMEDAVCSTLQMNILKNDESAAEIESLLESLKCDFLALCSRFSKTPDDQFSEVKTREFLNCIVNEAKEYVEKLIAETKIKERETINRISGFLEQSQNDIQREITVFYSVAQEEYEIEESEKNCFSLVSHVENVENKLLNIFIHLNRQRFEMENLIKRLDYFNKKFQSVTVKFDAYWQKSNTAYINAAHHLEESAGVWVSSYDDMNNNTLSFMQQFQTLKNILLDLQSVLKFRHKIVDCISPITEESSDLPEMTCMNKLKNCNQMLLDMLLTTETATDHLQTVSQLSEKVESLDNQMRSMAKCYVSSLKVSEKQRSSQSREISDSSLMVWDKKACLEINPQLEDSNKNRTIFILKNIVETTLEFIKFLSAGEKFDEGSIQSNDESQNSKVDEEWELASSVSRQDYMSGDYLVQNLDKFHFTE